jgi:hypothetical protein
MVVIGSGQEEERWMEVTAPCLLPEYHQIKAIRIASPRYWAQTIDLVAGGAQAEVLKKACTIYVKRKTGTGLFPFATVWELGVVDAFAHPPPMTVGW